MVKVTIYTHTFASVPSMSALLEISGGQGRDVHPQLLVSGRQTQELRLDNQLRTPPGSAHSRDGWPDVWIDRGHRETCREMKASEPLTHPPFPCVRDIMMNAGRHPKAAVT